MIGINGHTCIKDDGGTPNRRCDACEAEKDDRAAMAINPNPPGVEMKLFSEEMLKAFDRPHHDLVRELKLAEDPSGRKVRHSSKFSEWGTPDAMYAKLDKEFRFCLDAAANKANAKHLNFFGPDHDNPAFRDALKIGSWYDSVMDSFAWARPVFCNPPFSREEKIPIEPWIEKFWVESQRGLPVVTPIPASIQTKWWEQFVRRAHEVRIIPHRVAFKPPVGYEGAATGAGNNTAVVIWKPWDDYREPYEAVYRYWSYRD
jgi:site-specific DNA-methyltransferase (adenine-specific)